MPKILLTGAGAPGGPGIIKALLQDPQLELYIADADLLAAGRAILPQKFIQIPKAGADNFISFLQSICIEKNIDLIIPLVTKELALLAENKNIFLNDNIKIALPENDILSIANNKKLLLEKIKMLGISCPDFRVANTWEEIMNAAADLGYPSNRICIKPSISNGSRGFRILDENVNKAGTFFTEKPNQNIQRLSELKEIFEQNAFPEMLVMEELPGDEYSLDCLIVNRKPICILPRKRLAMREGISIKGEFVNEPEIIAFCKILIQALGLDGFVGIQLKADKNGKFQLLEMNPRLQGTSTAALGLGINLPVFTAYAALGMADKIHVPEIQWGLRFARYYDELYFT
jgi:carbamoyl-phosphate synthase large subunit